MNRCRILAEAVWNADRNGGLTDGSIVERVAKYFAEQGIDIARPYLNPGSIDQYTIPPGAEMATVAGNSS
jgi:hypothetical protein